MPKIAIDYSNSFVYKLCCNDTDITEIYIGSTTNMRQRKAVHKVACNVPTNKEYNKYKYQFIRDNGGFENWSMIMIEHVECDTKQELLARERYYIDQLKPCLNKQLPLRSQKEYYTDNKQQYLQQAKNYYINNKQQYQRNKSEIKICDCGIYYTHGSRAQHIKSNIHKKCMVNPFYKMNL